MLCMPIPNRSDQSNDHTCLNRITGRQDAHSRVYASFMQFEVVWHARVRFDANRLAMWWIVNNALAERIVEYDLQLPAAVGIDYTAGTNAV